MTKNIYGKNNRQMNMKMKSKFNLFCENIVLVGRSVLIAEKKSKFV